MSTNFQVPPGQRVEHALTIRNLPPGTTARTVLSALAILLPDARIFDMGRVIPGGIIPWDRVRVVLFTQAGAMAFFEAISSGRLVLGGMIASVAVSTAEETYSVAGVIANYPEHACRVLIVRGPVEIVDFHRLDAFFRGRVTIDQERYVTPAVEVNFERGGERELVLTFDSWWREALWAGEGIAQVWNGVVEVRYGVDPCEVGVVEAGRVNSHVGR
ncbi:hypothetical protein QBC37DRAFT_374970 [Rhypophila decipiens]|uniref:Uncharacterized protein n=1 Tax=Rhypophila decipiens TaxID=261697 RepID=A0AAN6YAQ0_9PEZI|nr:hypothetical protein QBC37DRAFT_374970 [Rhypophila decipiens]